MGDWFGTGVAIRRFETKMIGGTRGEVNPTQYPLIVLPAFATGHPGTAVGGSRDQTIETSDEGNPSNALGPLPTLKQHYCEAVGAGLLIEPKAAVRLPRRQPQYSADAAAPGRRPPGASTAE